MKRFEKALLDGTLDELAVKLHKEGLSRQEVYSKFEQFLDVVQKRNFEEPNDRTNTVMETMDRIWGFCRKENVLPLGKPGQLTSEMFEK